MQTNVSTFLSTIVVPFSLLAFLGCAHHQDVRPSENGEHLVVTKGEEREEAYRNARSQAEHYCDQTDKTPYVVSEDTQYVGEGSERNYLNNKKIAKAAKAGGFVGRIFMPTRGTRAVSGIASTAGFAGDAYLGEEYRISMRFKCKR